MSQTHSPSTHATPGSGSTTPAPAATGADAPSRSDTAGRVPAHGALALAWHITKKDLRALAPLALLCVLLTVTHAIATAMPPSLTMAEHQRMALLWLLGIIPFMRMLLFAVIGTLLVHADPLVSTDAFWLTRPIPRHALLASKLLSAGLLLALPSLLVQLALMTSFGVSVAGLADMAPDLALDLIVGTLFLLLAAALTSSLPNLLIWAIGIVIAVWIALALMVRLAEDDPWAPQQIVPRPIDPTVGVVESVLLAIGLGVALWHMYRTRRRGRTLLLTAAAMAVPLLVGPLWPGISFYGGEPQLQEGWARDAARSPMRLARNVREFKELGPYGLRNDFVQIAAPVVLGGVPDGFRPRAFTLEATVRAPYGASLASLRTDSTSVQVAAGLAIPALAAVDRGYMMSDREGIPIETWPVLFRVSPATLRQSGITVGEYEGRFQYSFERSETLATLPLGPGARYTDGPRSVALWPIPGRNDGCDIAIQTAGAKPRSHLMLRAELLYVFRHRPTGRPLRFDAMSAYTTGAFGRISFSPRESFSVANHTLSLRFSREQVSPNAQDPLTCADVDVTFVRESYAGRVERTLRIPEFHLDMQPGDLKGSPYR